MDQLFKQRVRDLITELRGSRSQTAFGELLGLSQSAISDYEKGKRVPDSDAIEKIAAHCGLLPEQLIAKFYGRSFTNVEASQQGQTIEQRIKTMSLAEKARLQVLLAAEMQRDISG